MSQITQKKMLAQNQKNEIIFVIVFILSVILVSTLFFHLWFKSSVLTEQFPVIVSKKFEPPEIKAKSAYVYDLTLEKMIYQKEALTPLPLASLTKIMTAIVSQEELSANASIPVIKNPFNQPDYLASSTGELWERDELTRFMLFVSSNIAAESLDQALKNENKGLVFLMNKKAEELGFQSLSFANASGLDRVGAEGSSYGSAKDISSLFIYATSFYPYLFEPTEFKEYNFISASGNNHLGINTNELAEKISGLYASKTGFTNLAGGNLVIGFEENGHKIVVVVLGSDKEARFTDVAALVSETIKVIN